MSDPIPLARGPLGRGLSLFFILVLGWSLVAQYLRGSVPAWVLVGALVALAAWGVLVAWSVPPGPVEAVCIVLMVVGGALTAAGGQGPSLVPAAVAVLWLTRDIRRPIWWGPVLGVLAMLLVVVGNALQPLALLGLIALEAGVVVAFFAGLSRRQFILAELRSRELVREHARTDVLAARARLAADIHDVLAHSLGGLVIQLDAVDALLESGDAAAAAAKVRDARLLAAEGLGEARRAVAALAEPAQDGAARVAAQQLVAELSALVTAHDSLGGTAELREVGAPHDVSSPVELALRRAVQEGLTNARKHAPGAAVEVVLTWTDEAVQLQLTNPLGSGRANFSGGHGLVGMRERFAALPGGSVSAGRSGQNFVVTVRANTA